MSLEDQEFDDNHDQPEDPDESEDDSLQEQKEEEDETRNQIPEWRCGKFTREQKLLRKFWFMLRPEDKDAARSVEASILHILEQLVSQALEAPLSKLV